MDTEIIELCKHRIEKAKGDLRTAKSNYCLSPQKLPKNKPNCLTENKMVELPQNEKGVKKRERKNTSCDQTEKV